MFLSSVLILIGYDLLILVIIQKSATIFIRWQVSVLTPALQAKIDSLGFTN